MKTPILTRPKLRTVVPFAAAAAVAITARRVRALSVDGALAATAIGGAIASASGVRGAAALLAFFFSSTLLGRLPREGTALQRRGNERDAIQVLANGGVAAAVASTMAIRPESKALLAGMGGALAAATADTWATEIGSRFGAHPRSILTGQRVQVGTSGGVSLAGILASAAGAASLAAIIGVGFACRPGIARPIVWAVTIGGVCGAVADSVLGAAIQEVRACHMCGVETELLVHDCGRPTTHVRGIAGIDNDAVNFAATLAGAVTSAFIARMSLTRLPPAKRCTTERGSQTPLGYWRRLADRR